MKKVYIEPKVLIFSIDDESALCAGTAPSVGGQITDPDYEDIITNPIDDGDVPITAKSGDIWDDGDEGSNSTGSNLFSDW